MADALEDTLDAAYSLSQIDFKPVEENERTEFFRAGVKALNSHLINRKFTLSEAKTAAARAALLASAIKAGRFDRPLNELRTMPADTALLKAMRIDGHWKKLHTLRKTNIEASTTGCSRSESSAHERGEAAAHQTRRWPRAET